MVVAHVITVSDRVARGEREDNSGALAREALTGAGHQVTSSVVEDGVESVSHSLRAALSAGARVVITSGGTGISPTDVTPEQTAPLVDYYQQWAQQEPDAAPAYHRVEGVGSVDDITSQVIAALES